MASVKELILASQSPFRKALLEAAGIEFAVRVAPIDEYKITASAPGDLALARAEAKAMAVAALAPGCLVVGADQVLSFAGQMFDKASTEAEARLRLGQLAGHTHFLHSATVLVQMDEGCAPRLVSTDLTNIAMPMRALTQSEIEAYVAAGEWRGSVGCYQYEHRGVHLFTGVQGDYSAIVGLPLQPLFAMLRNCGINPLTQPRGPWAATYP